MLIFTGSWFTPLPEGHIRIGISRGTPRGMAAGYRLFKALAPGQWFHSTDLEGYLDLYRSEVLEALDPELTLNRIVGLAAGRTPVLCCYERPQDIHAGATFCHRHIAAQWLRDRLGVDAPELAAPEGFDPWAQYRAQGITPPSFKREPPCSS